MMLHSVTGRNGFDKEALFAPIRHRLGPVKGPVDIRSLKDRLLHKEFATLWLLYTKCGYKSGQLNTSIW
jgi:hypothetical protein